VGASNGVSIRSLNGGPASNKTLVLLDGRPINDAWAGGVNFHSIPTELIDRIEVVRGPGSALYGSQASGGVINVFTKNPAPGFHGWVTVGHEFNASEDIDDASAEGYGRSEIAASRFGVNGSYGGGATNHFVSLGYKTATQSFPTPNENAWDNYDLFYKATHAFSDALDSRLTFNYHTDTWDNKAERSPGEVAEESFAGDVFTRWSTGRGVLSGRVYMNRVTSESTVYVSDLKTGQTSMRTGVIADYAMPLSASSMVIAGVDAYYDNADVDYDKTVVSMTPLGVGTVNVKDTRTGAVSAVQADTFTGRYGGNSQTYDENNAALFAQYSHSLSHGVNVVAGGRLDMHSEFGTVFNPKAGLTWDVWEYKENSTTIKVNYGTAFRAPPMWGLFSQSTGGYGSPDLKPEKTKNTDVGVFQRFGTMGHLELTFFHMDITDLLVNDKMGSTGEGYYVFVPTEAGADTILFNQRKNLGSYSPKGVELGFRLTPVSQVTVSGAYTYLDPRDFTFQTSRHRWNGGVMGFVPFGDNRIEAEVIYSQTGDGYFFDYESRAFDSFGIADARLTYDRGGRYRLSLNVKNLADKEYQLWHYAWQPGRTVSVSVETKF
jgi:outer membrane cobalamin receptor